MEKYFKYEDFCKEVDKGDLLVGNNAEWAKEIARRTPAVEIAENDCFAEQENHFVQGIRPEDDFLEILNWYRNLYHAENPDTEHGIVARAINDLFVAMKQRKAEDKFFEAASQATAEQKAKDAYAEACAKYDEAIEETKKRYGTTPNNEKPALKER